MGDAAAGILGGVDGIADVAADAADRIAAAGKRKKCEADQGGRGDAGEGHGVNLSSLVSKGIVESVHRTGFG